MVFIPPNKISFSDEQRQFLRDNYQFSTNRQLAAALGMQLTRVRMELYSMGLKRMEMEYWTVEQITFLQDNYRAIGDTELADMFTDRWPKNKGWDKKHIEKKRRYLKLKRTAAERTAIHQRNVASGCFKDCAKKRWETTGSNPIGTVVIWRVRNRMAPFIKIDGKYEHLNVHVWKQHHGLIPKGYNIIRVDGNPLNNALENLRMVTNAELAAINSKNRKKYPEDIRELERLVRKINKQIRNHGKNKMNDLRDHLFAQLERLSDDDLTPEQLEQELKKSEAIKEVASQIINSAKVEVDFLKATGALGTTTQLFANSHEQKQLG